VVFSHVLHAVIGLLVIEGRLSYRRLQAEFDLTETELEAIRFELSEVKRLALDQGGEILTWAGDGEAMVARANRPALAPKVAFRLAEPAAHEGAAEAAAPQLLAALPRVEPVASDAQRRPLTVMFCDLADSTALSSKLDPEDLQDVIRAYRERCTGVIREYEGFVAKYMGDGILVYFGYPKSLERNAERAVRTGLTIVEAITELNRTLGREKDIDLAVRIGIATGLVMVGEIVGEGLARERTVIGEAPNVAARLQGLAGRNGIVVGALTKEIAGDAFVYQELGAHELKGISGLVKTWEVRGLRADSAEEEADETETEGGGALAILIGRDEETGLLRRAWQSTKAEGRGRVVLISGEPGIGKSVLVDGLRAEVRAEGLPRIAFRCSPYHTSSALYPVIEHVKRLVRWQPEDTAETRLGALEAMLGGYSQPLAEVVPLFASLLSLPLPEERYPPLALSPLQQKQQTQDALIAWTLEEAERQPMLEVWEDLHWADPSTLELLGRLIEQAPTVPLLIMLTFRPDFLPSWPTRSYMTPVTLNRLERLHTEALVTRLAGDKPLPPEVVEHIVAKTDGVPLYVEELTKAILGSDILREEVDRYALTGTLSTVTIPATLQESLMARLDRLPKVREVTQLGAVLGRDFAYEMLHALAEVEEQVLRHSLGQLVEAELLYQRGRPPRSRYIFKHALLQDAAYQSLLKRKRQQYHRQVAELLEERFPETVEAQPELLAHHYGEAGLSERALVHWMRAGEHAVRRSANAEALAHTARCLDLLPAISDPLERARFELAIRMLLGPALIATKGYGALEVQQTYTRARELCDQVADRPRMFSVLRGLWNSYLFRAEMPKARERAAELLSLARDSDDAALVVEAHRVMATAAFFIGDFLASRSHAEQGWRFTTRISIAPSPLSSGPIRGSFAGSMAGFPFGCWDTRSKPKTASNARSSGLGKSLTVTPRPLPSPTSLSTICAVGKSARPGRGRRPPLRSRRSLESGSGQPGLRCCTDRRWRWRARRTRGSANSGMAWKTGAPWGSRRLSSPFSAACSPRRWRPLDISRKRSARCVTRLPWRTTPSNGSGRRNCIGCKASCCSRRPPMIRPTPRPAFTRPSTWRAGSMRGPWSCARRPAWLVSGTGRTGPTTPASC